MYGSDVGFDEYGEGISAILEADFLTDSQKRDILYNNAARFLRLTDEQIAEHHTR
jgi:predicted TIM-barrel fold metal-dependent hydrolase